MGYLGPAIGPKRAFEPSPHVGPLRSIGAGRKVFGAYTSTFKRQSPDLPPHWARDSAIAHRAGSGIVQVVWLG